MTNLETARAHEKRWRVLRELADKHAISLAEHADWELVIRFYAGLHILQAYFCTKDPRFQAARHDERIRAIDQSPELRKVAGFRVAYRMLQDMSEQVRYAPTFIVKDSDVQGARRNLGLLERTLEGKLRRALAEN
jgi:hypothetical protein